MNFLAHAALSFGDPLVLAGNLISDFVKGKQQFNYQAPIRLGITLHRAIDNYTDNHPLVHEMKLIFKPAYRLYAGAFVDVICDHFLANDETEFIDRDQLEKFTQECYQQLQSVQEYLPENFLPVFNSMRTHNWLYNYRFESGLEQSFFGLKRRAKYIRETETAFRIFKEHREDLEKRYRSFYPELKIFSMQTLTELKTTH